MTWQKHTDNLWGYKMTKILGKMKLEQWISFEGLGRTSLFSDPYQKP